MSEAEVIALIAEMDRLAPRVGALFVPDPTKLKRCGLSEDAVARIMASRPARSGPEMQKKAPAAVPKDGGGGL